ncbi:hypothetical protein Tco_0932629 [Tanacetum coccineum]
MYLTTSRPGIMFAVCACARFQVTPKVSHLYVMKRIFRYLKGQPKLGLWYPRDSPFDLEAFSDIANSTTEAEYVAAANCCGQVLWIQNQMLDYGFNFMNTKIHIDNESTICIVKNLVFHSKTKHIEIRHHFIRDSYEKRLIQVIKIHTDHNVADLLTKAFDVSRFSDEAVHQEGEIEVQVVSPRCKKAMGDTMCLQNDCLRSLGTYNVHLHSPILEEESQLYCTTGVSALVTTDGVSIVPWDEQRKSSIQLLQMHLKIKDLVVDYSCTLKEFQQEEKRTIPPLKEKSVECWWEMIAEGKGFCAATKESVDAIIVRNHMPLTNPELTQKKMIFRSAVWKGEQSRSGCIDFVLWILKWRLFDSYGGYVLLMNSRISIHMLIEKDIVLFYKRWPFQNAEYKLEDEDDIMKFRGGNVGILAVSTT